MILSNEVSRVVKLVKTESRKVVARAKRARAMED